MPGDGGKEEERLEASSSKGHRGKAFTYPELMCCLFAALGTNEKFSAGKPGAVRLQIFNNDLLLRVRWMKEHDKWSNKDGTIPSGKQVVYVQEGLRVAYFDSLTGAEPPEPVSSKDEDAKADRLESLEQARAGKLDKFHPMELYLYFHFGHAAVGGLIILFLIT
jgi:hypothetical protein